MGNKPGAIGLKRATYSAQSDWCQQQTRLNLIGASNMLSAIWLVLVTYPAQSDWFEKNHLEIRNFPHKWRTIQVLDILIVNFDLSSQLFNLL